jgi:hypothetical protein
MRASDDWKKRSDWTNWKPPQVHKIDTKMCT